MQIFNLPAVDDETVEDVRISVAKATDDDVDTRDGERLAAFILTKCGGKFYSALHNAFDKFEETGEINEDY